MEKPALLQRVSRPTRARVATRVVPILGLLVFGGLATAQPQREMMAVLDLEIVGSTKEQGGVLTNQLRAELLKTGRWTMINRAELDKIMKEQALQLQTCTEPSCAVQLGKLLGVRKIVTGQVTKVTDTLWQLSVTLTDVETGEIKRQEVVNHTGDFSSLFLSGMANLAQRLSATEQELAGGVTRLTPQSIAPKLHDVLRDAPAVALAISPDNARLFYGTGNTVRGWQIPGRAEAGKPIAIPKGEVSALAVNPQGSLVAAGSWSAGPHSQSESSLISLALVSLDVVCQEYIKKVRQTPRPGYFTKGMAKSFRIPGLTSPEAFREEGFRHDNS
jgi:hypothetical protein